GADGRHQHPAEPTLACLLHHLLPLTDPASERLALHHVRADAKGPVIGSGHDHGPDLGVRLQAGEGGVEGSGDLDADEVQGWVVEPEDGDLPRLDLHQFTAHAMYPPPLGAKVWP